MEMPQDIKNLLRNLDILYRKTQLLEREIELLLEGYGINPDDLRAVGTGEVQTEALAFITNCKGDVEENIADIEKVFLYYVNKKQRGVIELFDAEKVEGYNKLKDAHKNLFKMFCKKFYRAWEYPEDHKPLSISESNGYLKVVLNDGDWLHILKDGSWY